MSMFNWNRENFSNCYSVLHCTVHCACSRAELFFNQLFYFVRGSFCINTFSCQFFFRTFSFLSINRKCESKWARKKITAWYCVYTFCRLYIPKIVAVSAAAALLLFAQHYEHFILLSCQWMLVHSFFPLSFVFAECTIFFLILVIEKHTFNWNGRYAHSANNKSKKNPVNRKRWKNMEREREREWTRARKYTKEKRV